jgi:hypothetical protein
MPKPIDESDEIDPRYRLCGSCRWHDVAGLYAQARYDTDGGLEGWGNIGFCRRNPPVLINRWRVNDPRQQRFRPNEHASRFDMAWSGTFFPITESDQWCGEWQEDHRSHLERFGTEDPTEAA